MITNLVANLDEGGPGTSHLGGEEEENAFDEYANRPAPPPAE